MWVFESDKHCDAGAFIAEENALAKFGTMSLGLSHSSLKSNSLSHSLLSLSLALSLPKVQLADGSIQLSLLRFVHRLRLAML